MLTAAQMICLGKKADVCCGWWFKPQLCLSSKCSNQRSQQGIEYDCPNRLPSRDWEEGQGWGWWSILAGNYQNTWLCINVTLLICLIKITICFITSPFVFPLSSFHHILAVVSVSHWYHLQIPKTQARALFVMMLVGICCCGCLCSFAVDCCVVCPPRCCPPPSLQSLLFV